MSALYLWTSFGMICYLNAAILKSLYHEPRPFWVSSDIKPQKCRTDFGNPSGHSMATSFFWVSLYLHYYFEVGQRKKINTIFCTAYIVKMALTATLIIFLMFMALSRVYLGEHSYNQVFYGTQLGVYFAVTLHFIVKPQLKRLPKKLRNSSQITGNKSTFDINVILLLLSILLFIVLPIGLAFGIWHYSKDINLNSANWDQRLKVFCEENPFIETASKFNKQFTQSGTIGLAAGAILGQLFEMKFINLNLSYQGWNKTDLFTTVIRTLITGVMYGIFGCLYFIVNPKVPIEQIYYILAVKFFIPTFMSSFLIFAFARLIFYKLKLVNEKAVGRMFEINDEEDGEFTSASKHASNSLEFMEIEMSQKV
eukprot:403361826